MKRAALAALPLLFAACSSAPPLKVPDVPVAGSYKEVATAGAGQAGVVLSPDSWWTLYGDDELNALQKRLVESSPDLAAALARYQQSKAITDQVRAQETPTLGLQGNMQRDRQSVKRPLRVLGPLSPDYYGQYTVGVQADYEFDLWGRISNQLQAANANALASKADLDGARLSLQAQLADTYIVLRGLDREIALLESSVAAYAKALELTMARRDGGIASGLDVSRAQTQLASTRSQARQAAATRALSEHAIAALIGETASNFAIAPRVTDIALPDVPVGVPSSLLQRRPDIAAAQRRIVAANASVGVAQSAYFPTVTLSAFYGFQSYDLRHFISLPNALWAIGPSVFYSLFDGGRRTAEVSRTKAVLDEVGASYRGVVLNAFRQVEDNLALLGDYRDAAEQEREALAAAQRSLDLATARYREGAVNYLEVVTSQVATLQAQRNALDLDTRQRRASVQLIRALGGGWTADSETAQN